MCLYVCVRESCVLVGTGVERGAGQRKHVGKCAALHTDLRDVGPLEVLFGLCVVEGRRREL